jgi:hypothetical protein
MGSGKVATETLVVCGKGTTGMVEKDLEANVLQQHCQGYRSHLSMLLDIVPPTATPSRTTEIWEKGPRSPSQTALEGNDVFLQTSAMGSLAVAA